MFAFKLASQSPNLLVGGSMIRRIVPCLDDFSLQQVVFREALEWASRLHLPIHALCLRSEAEQSGENEERTCAETCSRRGVSWRVTRYLPQDVSGVPDFLRPDDLFLLHQRPRSAQKQFLFRCAGDCNGPAVGVCPDTFTPLSRILYVHQDNQPAGAALASVVELCRDLEAPLVVLSLAGSEREAWQQQRAAEEAFATYRYPADFDLLVGWDLRSAVVRVAGWRRCTHVVLERGNASAWWRWLSGDPTEQLLGLSEPVTFLTLPDLETSARIGTLIAKN
jgi:hypothetical protein